MATSYGIQIIEDISAFLRSDVWGATGVLNVPGTGNAYMFAGSAWSQNTHHRTARLWVLAEDGSAFDNDLHADALKLDPGFTSSYALGVNTTFPSTVVGGVVLGGNLPRPIKWEKSGATLLNELPATGGEAYSINQGGDIVGWSNVAPSQKHAVFWPRGAVAPVDLGTLGGSMSVAMAIKDAGQVTGWAQTANGETHAFLAQAAGSSAPAMIDLLPAGANGAAYSVNAGGDVVGALNGAAFLWSTDAGLQVLANTDGCTLRRLNVHRQAVGFRATAAGSRAVIWDAGALMDLNDAIDPGLGVTLTEATTINDDGVIGALGVVAGYGPFPFGYELVPQSPHSLVRPLPDAVFQWLGARSSRESPLIRALEAFGRDLRADAALCLQLATLVAPVDDTERHLQARLLAQAEQLCQEARRSLKGRRVIERQADGSHGSMALDAKDEAASRVCRGVRVAGA